MSEEILEHLMNLFGILAKQGGGASDVEINFLRKFLNDQIASAKVEGLIAAAPLNLYRSHRARARVANLVGKLVLDEFEGDLDNVLILLSRVLNVLLVFVGDRDILVNPLHHGLVELSHVLRERASGELYDVGVLVHSDGWGVVGSLNL